MDRRAFLKRSAAFAVGLASIRTALAAPSLGGLPSPYGNPVPDPNGQLNLPPGFSYQVIGHVGDVMDDGLILPDRFDGMCAFPGSTPNRVLVIRNHELAQDPTVGPFGPNNMLFPGVNPAYVYDRGFGNPCPGGTTTFEYDIPSGTVVRQELSLAGTLRNCNGGPTPWGSWLSCEETVQMPDGTHEQDHGWCFEVPVGSWGLTAPMPLRAMGRFNHEAAAVDVTTGDVFMTEDRDDGLIYRFVPNVPGSLHLGGKLFALRVVDTFGLDTSNSTSKAFSTLERAVITWVPLRNVESPLDDLRLQGISLGATTFRRGEGMWAAADGIYFTASKGGFAGKGQIWRLRVFPPMSRRVEGTLELLLEATATGPFANADSLTVAPSGNAFVCEDCQGPQRLIMIRPDGTSSVFAENTLDDSELAGVTFAPGGNVLFLNGHRPGRTYAITGPF